MRHLPGPVARVRLMEEGVAPLAVLAVKAAESPHDRTNAMHCLLNFTMGGQGRLRAAGAVEAGARASAPAFLA